MLEKLIANLLGLVNGREFERLADSLDGSGAVDEYVLRTDQNAPAGAPLWNVGRVKMDWQGYGLQYVERGNSSGTALLISFGGDPTPRLMRAGDVFYGRFRSVEIAFAGNTYALNTLNTNDESFLEYALPLHFKVLKRPGYSLDKLGGNRGFFAQEFYAAESGDSQRIGGPGTPSLQTGLPPATAYVPALATPASIISADVTGIRSAQFVVAGAEAPSSTPTAGMTCGYGMLGWIPPSVPLWGGGTTQLTSQMLFPTDPVATTMESGIAGLSSNDTLAQYIENAYGWQIFPFSYVTAHPVASVASHFVSQRNIEMPGAGRIWCYAGHVLSFAADRLEGRELRVRGYFFR